MKFPSIALIIGAATLLLGGGAYLFFTQSAFGCATIPDEPKVEGSQGYRVWSGPTLKSFTHKGEKLCVPEGWEAVGAVSTGSGWAVFNPEYTGVIVRSRDFEKTQLTFKRSSYAVTLMTPLGIADEMKREYRDTTVNAFENIGNVFGDNGSKPPRKHIVLVTADIPNSEAGTVERVYPDPNPLLTIYVRNTKNTRGEELFLHAVTHLYNRFGGATQEYLKHQSPIPEPDWQELEASWAETAFRTSEVGMLQRLTDLYSVHRAVQTGNPNIVEPSPLIDVESIQSMLPPSVVVPEGAKYIDVQYAHYILGPLTMVATEGLLRNAEAGADVPIILANLHSGKADNFFTELETALSKKDAEMVKGWMLRNEPIPRELVFLGAEYYLK